MSEFILFANDRSSVMKRSHAALQRLKESLPGKNGINPLFLKVLKSDLHRLLSQYASFDDIEFSVEPILDTDEYSLTIGIGIKEFFELGRGRE